MESVTTNDESRTDRGAILVWTALMALVLLGMAAFAVDLGYGYSVKRQLSATADAVALAGAQQGGLSYRATDGCASDGTPTETLEAAIIDAVEQTHDAQTPAGSNGYPETMISCDNESVTVQVTESSSLDTFFAGILGVTSLAPSETATANVIGSNEQGGLRPFTVCVNDATSGIASGETKEAIYQSATNADPVEFLVSNGDSEWTATGSITDNQKHDLRVGDYVRILITSPAPTPSDMGVPSGYYYVISTPTDKSFSVSENLNGLPMIPVVSGGVDVFLQKTGLVGEDLPWAEGPPSLVTMDGHPLLADDEVRITIEPGTASGALPGTYFVARTPAPTPTTFALSTVKGGMVQDLDSAVEITVYAIEGSTGPGEQGACESGTTVDGNWGYASFKTPTNGLNGNQAELLCLVQYGYGGPACDGNGELLNLGDLSSSTPEVTANGNSGNSLQIPPDNGNGQAGNNTYLAMMSLLDDIILLPVASNWTGQGMSSGSGYLAKGGIGVQFCGFAFIMQPNDVVRAGTGTAELPTCWEPEMYELAKQGRLDNATLYIQWRYAGTYISSYKGQNLAADDTCDLGGDESLTCIPVLRLVENER